MDKASIDKSQVDKAPMHKLQVDKSSTDKSLTDKTSTDKSSTDRSLSDLSSRVFPSEITSVGEGVSSSGILQPVESHCKRRNLLFPLAPDGEPSSHWGNHSNAQNERLLSWVRERNSNAAVMETLVEEESSARISMLGPSLDEDSSDDGIIVQTQFSSAISDNSTLPDDGEEEVFRHINRVMYVAVTLYQSSPFVVLLEYKYSNLYRQLLESLDKLDDIVRFDYACDV